MSQKRRSWGLVNDPVGPSLTLTKSQAEKADRLREWFDNAPRSPSIVEGSTEPTTKPTQEHIEYHDCPNYMG